MSRHEFVRIFTETFMRNAMKISTPCFRLLYKSNENMAYAGIATSVNFVYKKYHHDESSCISDIITDCILDLIDDGYLMKDFNEDILYNIDDEYAQCGLSE